MTISNTNPFLKPVNITQVSGANDPHLSLSQSDLVPQIAKDDFVRTNPNMRAVNPPLKKTAPKLMAANDANVRALPRGAAAFEPNTKTEMYSQTKHPVELDDVIARFEALYPGEAHAHVGSLELGLVVYSLSNPLNLVTVRSSAFIPSAFQYATNGQITDVIFGGVAGREHIEDSVLSRPNERTKHAIASGVDIMMRAGTDLESLFEQDRKFRKAGKFDEILLHGALQIGFELETWVIDPVTGDLAEVYDLELAVGMVEIDDGIFISPKQTARGMAFNQKDLEDRFPGMLITNTATPASGSVRNLDVNTYRDVKYGPYIAIVERTCFKRYHPRESASMQVREQQVQHEGYESVVQMIAEHGNCRSWTTAAAHMNLGTVTTINPKTGRYEVGFDHGDNLSRIAMSELGVIARMLTASSPYINGVAPIIDGHRPIDVRTFISGDMGTAAPQNQEIRDAQHYLEIVKATMTQGGDGSDRLDRAVVVHTNPDGSYTATAHGAGRWRFTDTGEATARIEYTGAGTATILPKARAMAILQYFQGIELLATNAGLNVLDFIAKKTGIKRAELQGNAHKVLQDFMLRGIKSEQAQALFIRLEKVLRAIDIPALRESKEIALAALTGIKSDGDIFEFAQGKGTLGGALARFADAKTSGFGRALTGLEVAHIVDAFQRQESEFLRNATDSEINDYLMGKQGFIFKMPIFAS